jgi:ketosteroid isomerase-like protein
LRASYAWEAARGNHEGIVAHFERDGVFELLVDDRRKQLRGHDAIRAHLRATMRPQLVFPMIHNDIIRVEGGQAAGTCVMQTPIAAGESGRQLTSLLGYYHDLARRQPDGRWLFAERRWFLYSPVFEESGFLS